MNSTTANKTILSLLALVALTAACGSSNNNGGGGVMVATKPTLGAQIDRLGRPGVNTALTDPFDTATGMTIDQVKDNYNAGTPPGSAQHTKWIAGNLAILDGLDRNCGNQLIAKPASGGVVPADRYMGLAGVLADDQLYVRTDSTKCSLYLAVEADATGLTSGNGDCGGRTPTEDVIDETYSLLAIGAPSGVTDGVNADANAGISVTAFPFLTSPN